MRVGEAMTDLAHERQQAHAYLDQLPPAQLSAIHSLLESMLDPVSRALTKASVEDEGISEEEGQAVERSKKMVQAQSGNPVRRRYSQVYGKPCSLHGIAGRATPIRYCAEFHQGR